MNVIIAIPDNNRTGLKESLIFDSQNDAAQFFGISKTKLSLAITNGTMIAGYYLDFSLIGKNGEIFQDVLDKTDIQAKKAYTRKMQAKKEYEIQHKGA